MLTLVDFSRCKNKNNLWFGYRFDNKLHIFPPSQKIPSSAALQNDEKRYNQTIPKIGKASKKEKTLFHKSYYIFCTFAI